MTILFFIVLTVFVAVANKQIGFILMKGSIFEPLRRAIGRKAPASFFARKLKELFSCKLCMSAQTGLLFFATPAALFGTNPLTDILVGETTTLVTISIGGLLWFTTGMYVSSVTMLAWNALEYLPERNRILQEHYEAIQSLAAKKVGAGDGEISLELFCELIAHLEKECDPIFWCGFERLACRKETAEEFLEGRFDPDTAKSILARLSPRLRQYFAKRETDDAQERLALQAKIYAQT
jgi:hypothetical protein